VLDRLKFDVVTENACDLLMSLVRMEAARLYGIASTGKFDKTPALLIDAQDVAFLGKAMKDFQAVKYRALDIPAVTVVKNNEDGPTAPGDKAGLELLQQTAALGPEYAAELSKMLQRLVVNGEA
jgi:hypothetical protein